jgi:hypothetical protein
MSSFGEQDDLLELNKDDFDFSLQFEQLFFSIIPSVLFVVFSLWRSLSQARKPTVVDAPVFQLIKLVCLVAPVLLNCNADSNSRHPLQHMLVSNFRLSFLSPLELSTLLACS